MLLLIAAGVISVGWVLWVVIGGITGISHKLVSYHVVDATFATVDITVTKDVDATAACALKALNESYATVGWNTLTVGPSTSETAVVRGEIRTDSLAVTAVVENCWIVK